MVTRTQYIRVLEHGCLVNPISPDQTIYGVLCHRLLEDGGSIPKAIERGRFGIYQRRAIPDIVYA